ncbi:hypothetical protein SGM_4163 [Streptomyces griseoaurantiacus M045]|uniref:Uncharacterized protein n=1 Tax=Streptomyces griseoaurantiacus M045 TaxID=996637 RepID=F3NMG0_9ACTN|nr:hypothetical protein SGM_4163 [Streptomyces griseoaurantiacus M045]
MAGVVAALVTHYVVHGATEQVGRLSLALVTPLSTEQHKCGHARTPLPGGACPRSGAYGHHPVPRTLATFVGRAPSDPDAPV